MPQIDFIKVLEDSKTNIQRDTDYVVAANQGKVDFIEDLKNYFISQHLVVIQSDEEVKEVNDAK